MKLLFPVATLLAAPVAGSSNKKSALSTTGLLRAVGVAAAVAGAAASNPTVGSTGAVSTQVDPASGSLMTTAPSPAVDGRDPRGLDELPLISFPIDGLVPMEDWQRAMQADDVPEYCPDCNSFEFWHYSVNSINHRDWDSLADRPNLNLIIEEGRMDDYGALRDLPRNLKSLSLRYSRFEDLSVLNGLEHLEYLHLDHSAVKNMKQPLNLPNLKVLSLSGCQVEDISGLASLKSLVHLDLSSTKVKDVSALAELNNLQTLQLGGAHHVANVDALAGLKKLKELNLRTTPVTNVDALSAIRTLRKLDVRGSYVYDNVETLRSNLPHLEILADPPKPKRSSLFNW